MNEQPRFASDPDVVLTELADGSGVLLHLKTKFYYTLNPSAVCIWKAIDGGASTLSHLAERLRLDFDVDATTASTDVATILQQMTEEQLIQAG